MEKMKTLYASESEVPKDYASLYEEVDGKFILTGVEDLKTQADIQKVLDGKTHEVKNHKLTKKELDDLKEKFEGIDPSKYKEMVAAVEHSKLKKEHPDQKDLEKVILQNDLGSLRKELDLSKNEVLELKNEKKTSKIEKITLATARKLNLDPQYDEDVLLRSSFLDIAENGDVVSKDGKSIEDYLTPLIPKFGLPSKGDGSRTQLNTLKNKDENAEKFKEAKKAGNTKDMLLYAPTVK